MIYILSVIFSFNIFFKILANNIASAISYKERKNAKRRASNVDKFKSFIV